MSHSSCTKLPSQLPDLMRRLNRKLDIQRGMTLTYDDLALLVASGAYGTLQAATREYLEHQCREHVARSRSISAEPSASTPDPDETTKSFGMTESASEALARAQAISKPGVLRSIASTLPRTAAQQPARRAAKR